jgi:predicted flap endonuclease-1-like 5' DNA nuclease
MIWCVLIPLLTGLICGILGYLLGKMLNKNNQFDDSIYKSKISKLETDLELCKASKVKLKSTKTTTSTNIASSMSQVSVIAFNSDAAKAVFGKKIKENDLTLVEGIGPKIKDLFHNHNVNTWQALSQCSLEKCKEVLESGGNRYKIHKPDSWPKQAEMAAQGKWQELKDWQDQLDGGK